MLGSCVTQSLANSLMCSIGFHPHFAINSVQWDGLCQVTIKSIQFIKLHLDHICTFDKKILIIINYTTLQVNNHDLIQHKTQNLFSEHKIMNTLSFVEHLVHCLTNVKWNIWGTWSLKMNTILYYPFILPLWSPNHQGWIKQAQCHRRPTEARFCWLHLGWYTKWNILRQSLRSNVGVLGTARFLTFRFKQMTGS